MKSHQHTFAEKIVKMIQIASKVEFQRMTEI